MTREEAITKLKKFCHNCEKFPTCVNTDKECFKALKLAIKALEQEPCEDCISREQAIKCLECDFDITGRANMEVVVNYINSAHDKIMNLPSVKQEQKTEWIPVSERLPEKNVEVLITTEWSCITIGEMFSNNDWFIHEGATSTNIDDIKAWMPLPKPYSEVSE